MPYTSLILAGGRSSRMGTSKPWLPFGRTTLLGHMVEIVQKACGEILVVGAPGQTLPPVSARVIRDEIPGQGPLSGLHAGLSAASNDLCFATSCDAPFLKPEVARAVLAAAEGFDAVVTRWGGQIQPMQAAYRKACLPIVSQLLKEKLLRPAFIFDRVKTRVIEEDEIRALDPDGDSFSNMNTPEDYAKVLKRAGGISFRPWL